MVSLKKPNKEPEVLTFEVDPETDVPIWVQLDRRIIFLIESGRLHPGDQLPTVRGLASQLSINYNTVNKAYLRLANDGYIESTRGRGAFVSDSAATLEDDVAGQAQQMLDECLTGLRELGLDNSEVSQLLTKQIRTIKKKEASR
jgi:GntR family transcriptional regulator